MSIFVIGDLHLSFSTNKPMNIFGDNWDDHYNKIKKDWMDKVSDDDLVLLTGDTSWGINLSEASKDLEWIDELPGRKIIIKGNHDYWWGTLAKMNPLYPTIEFINNNYYVYKNIAICGSRGWICPNDNNFKDHDLKIYKRELRRLEKSIKLAKEDGYDDIIALLHYPPTNDQKESSGFTEIFEKYSIKNVYYGHLHTENSFHVSIKGELNGVNYFLTSCDYLKFKLLKVR